MIRADVPVVYMAASFWESGAHCFVGEDRTLRWCLELERVLFNGGLHYLKDKLFGTPYVIAVDRYFPEARWTTGSSNGTRLRKLRVIDG